MLSVKFYFNIINLKLNTNIEHIMGDRNHNNSSTRR
jgi:hypothetical protein